MCRSQKRAISAVAWERRRRPKGVSGLNDEKYLSTYIIHLTYISERGFFSCPSSELTHSYAHERSNQNEKSQLPAEKNCE